MCDQKEFLVLNNQLNWYIFPRFIIKIGFIFTGLIIISCNISSYVHRSHFHFNRKRWFSSFHIVEYFRTFLPIFKSQHWRWSLVIWLNLKPSIIAFGIKSNNVTLIKDFSLHFWKFIRHVRHDPWCSLLNYFSNVSFANNPHHKSHQ